MTQPQAEFLDLYRAGLKTAADLMKASLQNAERLQNQQLVAIRTALDQQSKRINDLGQARSMDELLSLQTRIAGAQFERAVGFWSELYQTQVQQAQSWLNEMNSTAQSATSQRRRRHPPGFPEAAGEPAAAPQVRLGMSDAQLARPQFAHGNSSIERGQLFLSRRESARSARIRPPVWQRAQ